MAHTDEVFLGIDWSGGTPCARVGRLGAGASDPTELVPLDRPFRFRADGDRRHCCGWFDLTGRTARHIPCPASQPVATGVQCPSCRYQEGFTTAHRSHQGQPTAGNVRDHLAQPHWLYLAAFAGGEVKVGTVAESRRDSRLPEQGALAARYVARAGDGMAIRRAEDAVARGLGVATGVSRRRKLAGLARPVDLTALATQVDDLAARCAAVLAGTEVECVDDGVWQAPVPTAAALERPRRAVYPRSLSAGVHALVPLGVVGSIVATATEPDDGSCFLADLGELRGHPIERGGYTATVDDPVQFPLF